MVNNGLIARKIMSFISLYRVSSKFLSPMEKVTYVRKHLSVQNITSLFTRIVDGGKAWKGGEE